MGHPTIVLPFLLLILGAVVVNTVRVPSAIPFPHKEELEYLTSEEEERLIYGGDESVIISKIKDMPDGLMHPPNPKSLPVPTMDPPLPEGLLKKRRTKSNRGFPFRIPRVFLKQGARLITPLKRKPRTRVGSEIPVPSYRARPSSLVSSEPDQLEVAFKRIEIMASRAGLNMSAMPRRTQMQVLNRLMPKLPPKLAHMVKQEMKDPSSDKIYHYLPEPMKDPLVEDTQAFVSSYIEDDVHLGDEFSDFSVQQHAVQKPDFDASKISITDEDIAESHEQFGHLPSLTTEKYSDDKGSPNYVLIPPSELHDDLHDYNSHKYEAHNMDRETLFSRDVKHENPSYTKPKSALLSSQPDYLDSQSSDNLPSVISAGSKPAQLPRAEKSLRLNQLKTAAPTVRVSLPTKDRFVTIPQQKTKFHNLTEPIRVSIISKDRISINRSSDPIVKVIHIEPVKPTHDEVKSEEVPPVVEEVKDEEKNPIAENEAHKQLTRVKLITKDVIKAEEDKYKLSQEKQRSRATTTTTTTTARTTVRPVSKNVSEVASTMDPDIMLKLDMYDDNDWSENTNYDEFFADQYDLTDDEIAATVAELKKYEEQSSIDNSLEQEYPWRLTPHPLEYPDHPDHPKDAPEEPKEKEKKPEPGSGPLPERERPPPGFPRRPGHGGMMRRPPMRRPPFRRPPHHRRPPPRPMGPRPLRVNDVTISEIPKEKEFSKECDYFSDDLCLVVQDYPIEAISEALEQHPDVASVLVKEPELDRSWVDGVPRTQEHNYNFKHYFGHRRSEDETPPQTTHRHRDFAGEGGFLCPSKVAYGQVKKAKSSSTGEWKYVVNFGENTQTLRLEKCLSPGNTCSYVMPHYRTACTQVHNYHRLLAWDSEKGLHMDVFKIPTCCTCHVQGYYIPQSQTGLGFTPRQRGLPPKLKFSPPPFRGPFARGGKKMPPSLLTPVPNGPHPNAPNQIQKKPAIVVTDLSNKPNDKTKEHAISSSAKELKDDLHDLLAQYSALRERIAKKKNENLHVSYIANISNSTDALRPKTRESRNPTKLKPALLQLKKLQLMKLKKMNMTTKDGKLKKPLARARAMLLARINRKLKSSRSGRAMRQELNRLGAVNNNKNTQPGGGGVLSMESLKSRIQQLRSRLNKYNERNKMRQSSVEERIRDTKSRVSNRVSSGKNSSSQPITSNSKATSQRLRISSNRPSKVNYSYHPIMDYFNSKKQ